MSVITNSISKARPSVNLSFCITGISLLPMPIYKIPLFSPNFMVTNHTQAVQAVCHLKTRKISYLYPVLLEISEWSHNTSHSEYWLAE